MEYIKKVENVVELLEKKGLFINHFWLNPPATEEEIHEVETTLGYNLDEGIKAFYRACNGLQLIWSHPENEHFEHQKTFQNSKEFISYGITDDFRFDGCILIEPIKDVFLQDWYDHIYFDFTIENEDEIVFGDKTYIEPDFSKRIKPFDLFDSFWDVSFFLNGSSNPPLILGIDYHADYLYSKKISFENYIYFLLKTYGSVKARQDLLECYDGHKEPPINQQQIIELSSLDYLKPNLV